MRWSQSYIFTAREAPKDAEVVSHRLLVRAGMIRKLAAGIYSYLPLGWRSLEKMIAVVRREMNAAGAVELVMPAIQPAELWQESGRWQAYGVELLRMRDRHERDFCFGPTHEEVVTDIVRRDVKSYRQLPFNLYQIQVKFRDEIRPRFGLMRGREFLMKDAYSFDIDDAGLDVAYEAMRTAYCKIFEACGLDYTMVEADTGTIGGSASHEFMVVADTGESAVVRCPDCGYAANVEKAEIGRLPAPEAATEELRRVDTPAQTTVEEVAAFLGVEPGRVVKTLLYQTDKGPVAALVRGDRELNEVKLGNAVGASELRLAREDEVEELSGAPVGFAGPLGLSGDVRLIGDETVKLLTGFVCGANAADAHYVGANWDRDLPDLAEWQDLLLAQAGDPCPRCDGELELYRGIEVGHIFRLGTKYSEAMSCTYTDEAGELEPMVMGCYGLGIGRTVAAAIEQNHDDDGIIWPLPLAPYEVVLLSLNPNEPEVSQVADGLYDRLRESGVDVIYDDRDERPGVKFKDADLIGFPVRLVVGKKSLAEDKVEISTRREREKLFVPTVNAVAKTLELLLPDG
jgi:prolyl-tRNA synthetase